MEKPLPASSSKHYQTIYHPLPRDPHTVFSLRQLSASTSVESDGATGDDSNTSGGTGSTGTTLWLGAQVLAAYLSSLPPPRSRTSVQKGGPTPSRPRVIDLGAGVGYLALTLAALGYDVVATDVEPVVSTVLQPNIRTGLRVLDGSTAGKIIVRHLDWFDDNAALSDEGDEGEIELIVTTDTLYAPHLTSPLWSTLSRLAGGATSTPSVWIALERRDPRLIDSALEHGRKEGFDLRRIAHGRVAKALERTGWAWAANDWADVEIWKAVWKGK